MKRMLGEEITPEGRMLTDPAAKHVDQFNHLIALLMRALPEYVYLFQGLDHHASEIAKVRFSQKSDL